MSERIDRIAKLMRLKKAWATPPDDWPCEWTIYPWEAWENPFRAATIGAGPCWIDAGGKFKAWMKMEGRCGNQALTL